MFVKILEKNRWKKLGRSSWFIRRVRKGGIQKISFIFKNNKNNKRKSLWIIKTLCDWWTSTIIYYGWFSLFYFIRWFLFISFVLLSFSLCYSLCVSSEVMNGHRQTGLRCASWARTTEMWHQKVKEQSTIDPITIFGCGVRPVEFKGEKKKGTFGYQENAWENGIMEKKNI